MEIRKADDRDIELLTGNRMEFLASLGPVAQADSLRAAIRSYLQEHIRDGSVIYYICTDDGRIVSACCLCICQTMPTRRVMNGREGLLLNVYTNPEYRRMGLATTLIGRVVEEARAAGVGRITLDYTDDGYPLYVLLGFQKNERVMELWL